MNAEVVKKVDEIIGQICMRKEVGSMRSLSLGFGRESLGNHERSRRRYRAWELGTYSGDWKVFSGIAVVLAKSMSSDSVELNEKLTRLELGRFLSINELSKSSVRVNLDNGIAVEFTGDETDDDEYFHIFCPESLYVEFSERGWQLGRSDAPKSHTSGP